jgi:hypothetical protein
MQIPKMIKKKRFSSIVSVVAAETPKGRDRLSSVVGRTAGAMRAEDPVGGVSVTEVIATPGSDTPADASDETEMPSWPLLQAVWMVFLVVKKNLQLRSNRPTATILEVLFPLVAFVALAVLTPRNEYFDAAYTPAAPWMPPACVLQHALPTSLNGTEVIPAALIPKVCPGAGHLSGPHVVVPFAPDTNATRYLMRAICELRYAPPGVDVVGYSHTTMATRGSSDNKISMALPKSSSSANPVSASETNAFSDETASRRKLLFGPSQSPPGPPAPPSPPPAPSWPACTPTGYVDEETMARAVANGAAGGHADAVAIFFALDDETGGAISKYEIRAAADADNRALEMQERIGDVFVALAGTGSIIDVATTLTTNPPTPNMYRQFPMDPVYATGAFTFVAKFLPLTLVVTCTYCAFPKSRHTVYCPCTTTLLVPFTSTGTCYIRHMRTVCAYSTPILHTSPNTGLTLFFSNHRDVHLVGVRRKRIVRTGKRPRGRDAGHGGTPVGALERARVCVCPVTRHRRVVLRRDCDVFR